MEYRRKSRVLAWQYHPEATVPHWLSEKIGNISTLKIPDGHWFTLENFMVSRWSPDVFESVFEPVV